MTYEEYEAEVQKHLTSQRFYHSQCVAAEAARLARRYGGDVEQARLAGILHDIMKDTPPEEQLKILGDSGIILSKTQQRNRKLWHSLSGAAYLRDKLGVAEFEMESGVLQVGDEILITGPTTGALMQTIDEIRVALKPVQKTVKGERFSIRTDTKIRPSDRLYKMEKVQQEKTFE